MIYTDMTKKAINYMFENHKNQVDKSGLPYVFHPWHVAEEMDDECSTSVALMHDLIEDTSVSIEDIKKMGFNDEVISALKLLTHDENIDYFDYIKQIKQNEIARKVKIADLKHNMDISRISGEDKFSDKTRERIKKYLICYDYLNDYIENLPNELDNRASKNIK